MVCRSWGLLAFALLIGCAVGCVEVPDTVRAQFAGPGPQDRTNYRPGNHGVEPAPVAKSSPEASSTSTTTTTSADAAEAGVATETATDAGAP
jgi:hypothetical protein